MKQRIERLEQQAPERQVKAAVILVHRGDDEAALIAGAPADADPLFVVRLVAASAAD